MKGMLLGTAPLLLAIAILPACEPRDETETGTTEGLETPATDTIGVRTDTGMVGGMTLPRTVSFQPGPAGGNVSGTLTIEETMGGDLELQVDLMGLTQGEYAWHIHQASCDQEGPIVVPFTDTRDMEGIADPLEAGQDGRATAEVSIPADRLPREQFQTGQFSLHVHQGAGVDPGPTIACADLSGNTGRINR